MENGKTADATASFIVQMTEPGDSSTASEPVMHFPNFQFSIFNF